MKAKKFIPLLAAATTVTPSIALAHDPCRGAENDLTRCIAVTVGICLIMMWLYEKAATSSGRNAVMALFNISLIIGAFLSVMSLLGFYNRFHGQTLLALYSLIVTQGVIAYVMFCMVMDKRRNKKEDTDMPDE
jgi:ABC-type spermidine/putrescine transport system permease subunit II